VEQKIAAVLIKRIELNFLLIMRITVIALEQALPYGSVWLMQLADLKKW
jgi:hypothetical protein